MTDIRIDKVIVNTGTLDAAAAHRLRRGLPAALGSLDAGRAALRIDTLVIDLPPAQPLTADRLTRAVGEALARARRGRP